MTSQPRWSNQTITDRFLLVTSTYEDRRKSIRGG